jgi:hypothetical protein
MVFSDGFGFAGRWRTTAAALAMIVVAVGGLGVVPNGALRPGLANGGPLPVPPMEAPPSSAAWAQNVCETPQLTGPRHDPGLPMATFVWLCTNFNEPGLPSTQMCHACVTTHPLHLWTSMGADEQNLLVNGEIWTPVVTHGQADTDLQSAQKLLQVSKAV